MPSPAEVQTREYPAAELYVDCGPFQLGDAPADTERVPVQILIRSNEGVERWGEIWYHDFAGMRRKDRVGVDWVHDGERMMGYLDTFQVKRDGLHASGFVVLVEGDEFTPRIVAQARAGIPFEASIYFGGNGMRIEEVSAGAKAEVNGRKVQGPAVIFREWPLRGVAICPYGADGQTRTKLNEPTKFTVTVTHAKEDPMHRSKPNMEMQDGSPNPDEPLTKGGFLSALARAFGLAGHAEEEEPEAPQETEGDGVGNGPPPEQNRPTQQAQEGSGDAAAAETPAAGDPNPGKRFLDAFGDQLGGLWFAEGLTFEQAQERFVARLRAENDELNKKLSAVDRGEEDPAEFADGDKDQVGREATKLAGNLGDRGARLAALVAAHRLKK